MVTVSSRILKNYETGWSSQNRRTSSGTDFQLEYLKEYLTSHNISDSKRFTKSKKKKPAISSCKEKRRHIFVLFWPSTNCGLATNNETRAKSFLILGSSGSSWDLVTVRPSSTRRGGLRLEVLAELGDLGSWSHLSSGQTDQFWQDELRETFSIHTLENG